MKATRLTPDDFRRMPWKNGLGVTTEIARSPATGDSYDWRISIADVVSDGPFSRFDGIDRIILTIEGEGMILTHPESDHTVPLESLEPYRFSGEWGTICKLRNGPIRDFNVMTRRETTRAVLSVLELSTTTTVVVESETALIYCVSGSCLVELGGMAVTVDGGEAIRIDDANELDSPSIVPAGSVVLLWVRMSGP